MKLIEFLLVALVVVLDQFTKWLIVSEFQPGEYRPIIDGFFNLTLTYNRGVAFGIFAGVDGPLRGVLLWGTTAVALALVAFLRVKEYRHSPFGQVALSLVVAGALGNVIDRFRLGQVIDFLDFYYSTSHWPAFNVADSAICIGVGLLFIEGVFNRPTPKSS